jgi:hypothetical protein
MCNRHLSFVMHYVAVTAVTMHYADEMYLPMVGMISTQKGKGKKLYLHIYKNGSYY